MIFLSEDKDLVKYEPKLFSDTRFGYFLRAQGTAATLANGILNCANESFVDVGIEKGFVVYLNNESTYLFVVVEEVIDNTKLKVSLIGSENETLDLMPKDQSSLEYRIVSYKPMVEETVISLSRYFGLKPGNPASCYDIQNVLDAGSLRQACVYGVLASVFERLDSAMVAKLEAAAQDTSSTKAKAIHYRAMYQKIKSACVFKVRSDSGGYGIKTFRGGSFGLSRG